MEKRPYFNLKTSELDTLIQENPTNFDVLESIKYELSFRERQSSKILYQFLSDYLDETGEKKESFIKGPEQGSLLEWCEKQNTSDASAPVQETIPDNQQVDEVDKTEDEKHLDTLASEEADDLPIENKVIKMKKKWYDINSLKLTFFMFFIAHALQIATLCMLKTGMTFAVSTIISSVVLNSLSMVAALCVCFFVYYFTKKTITKTATLNILTMFNLLVQACSNIYLYINPEQIFTHLRLQ